MYNFIYRLPYSVTSLFVTLIAVLTVAYIGLIAVAMSYAALTVEFSQSVRNDEAAVAVLERQYFVTMTNITKTDYAAAGYTTPSVKVFVPAKSVTALR
jgi:hypothetical protein